MKRVITVRRGGDAFLLIGLAMELAEARGLRGEEVKAITQRMRSGDYANLETVFLSYFGDEIELRDEAEGSTK